MNWAKRRAEVLAYPLKDWISQLEYDALVDRIAAELQRVADECAQAVAGTDPRLGDVSHALDSIRAKFPKEGA